MQDIKLSIVDQSPVHDNKSQVEALNDTVKLAQLADFSSIASATAHVRAKPLRKR